MDVFKMRSHAPACTPVASRIVQALTSLQAVLLHGFTSTCIIDVSGNLLIHGHLQLGIVLKRPPYDA